MRIPPSILTCLLIAGCKGQANAPPDEINAAPVVCVVNYPLMYFTQRIAGDDARVRFPVPADQDPASWRPTAEQIAEIQSSDLIVLNGAGYAKWVSLASLPASKIVDTSASFSDRYIETREAATHSHGPACEHSHAGTAFTTWLDFQQAAAQARAIDDALSARRTGQADTFAANLSALRDDLLGLDSEMTEVARRIGDTPLVVSNAVYQYWARRYGLNVRAVDWEPGVVPNVCAVNDLKAILVEHPASVMIWHGEPDARSIELLASMGLATVVFDPCGNVPRHGDFLAVMRQNIRDLDRASGAGEGNAE